MLKSRQLEDNKMTIKSKNLLSIKTLKPSSLTPLSLVLFVLCLLLLTHNTYATDNLNEYPHNSSSSTNINNINRFKEDSIGERWGK